MTERPLTIEERALIARAVYELAHRLRLKTKTHEIGESIHSDTAHYFNAEAARFEILAGIIHTGQVDVSYCPSEVGEEE